MDIITNLTTASTVSSASTHYSRCDATQAAVSVSSETSDHYTSSDTASTVLPSENYSKTVQAQKTSAAPERKLNQLKYSYDVHDTLKEYYSRGSGSCNPEELKALFNRLCEADTPSQRNIQYAYDYLYNNLPIMAVYVCSQEGDAIDSTYSTGERDYVYYDSYYYYAVEEAKDYLESFAKEYVEANPQLDDLDYNGSYRMERVGKNCTFNEVWSNSASLQCGRACMVNVENAPPKDFTLFYKERFYSGDYAQKHDVDNAFKGLLLVNSDGLQYSRYVPFNISLCDGPLKYLFSGSELIDNEMKKTYKDYDSLLDFMDNFNFFTRGYYAMHENDIKYW